MAQESLSQIKNIVRQYVEELKKKGVRTEKVILYGSYSKGTAKSYSDIDLVIISQDLAKWPPIERLQMLSRATLRISAPLEVLGYTPQEILEHGDESIFWEEISKTGKEIYKIAA